MALACDTHTGVERRLLRHQRRDQIRVQLLRRRVRADQIPVGHWEQDLEHLGGQLFFARGQVLRIGTLDRVDAAAQIALARVDIARASRGTAGVSLPILLRPVQLVQRRHPIAARAISCTHHLTDRVVARLPRHGVDGVAPRPIDRAPRPLPSSSAPRCARSACGSRGGRSTSSDSRRRGCRRAGSHARHHRAGRASAPPSRPTTAGSPIARSAPRPARRDRRPRPIAPCGKRSSRSSSSRAARSDCPETGDASSRKVASA